MRAARLTADRDLLVRAAILRPKCKDMVRV
jgi:hypothetical protein